MKRLKIAKADPRVVQLVKDIKKNAQIKKFFKKLTGRVQPDKQGWYKGNYKISYAFSKGSSMAAFINFWFDAGYEDPFMISVNDDHGFLKGRGVNMGSPVSIFKTLDNITAEDYANALKQVLRI